MTQISELIGIGTDIIAIARFAKSIDKYGQNFLDKLFTKEEQEYCNKFKDSTERYAARFSAKEAVVKALGCGFGKEIAFLDINITKDELGKPHIKLSTSAKKQFNSPHISISLSHCKEYATATAIAFS